MARLRVRVLPGAKRTEVTGFQEGVLRLKLAAPAIEGRANEALIKTLADLLDVPKSSVTIKTGLGAREKSLQIEGLADEEILARLMPFLPA